MSKEFPAYSVDNYVRETEKIDDSSSFGIDEYKQLTDRLTSSEVRWLWLPIGIFTLAYLGCYLANIEYGSSKHATLLYLIFVIFNITAAIIAVNSWNQTPSRSIAKDSMLMLTLSLCSAAIGNTFDTIFWLTNLSPFKQNVFTNLFFVFAILFALPGVHLLARICRVKFGNRPIIHSIGLTLVFVSIPIFMNSALITQRHELNNLKEFIFGMLYAIGIGYLAALSLHLCRYAQGRMQNPARLIGIGLILLSFGCAIYAGLFMNTPTSEIPSSPVHLIIAMGYILAAMGIRRTELTIRIIFNLKDPKLPPSLPLIEIFGPSQGLEVYQKMETRIKGAFEELLRSKAEAEVKQKIISELESEVRLRKETELALIHEKEKAEEANRTKSQFLAMMSHELKTPLTAIKGYGQLLQNPPDATTPIPEQKTREIAEQIVFNSRHLQVMIDGILRFSQLESGKFTYHREEFFLSELTDYLETLLNQQQQFSNAKFCLHVPESQLRLYTDKLSLQHIVVNLLMNAIKFCKEGEISLKITHSGSDLVIEAKDTGIGIAEDHLDKIFEAFYQVSHGHRRKYGGAGLGLSIVKKLTEELNGKVIVESKLDHGSRFEVTLPDIVREKT
ncbi:MAG: HAMP domain-containing histidine kinase [Candidatus Riflebacteria bacterium]|nr:HAMP domain-containing histidine kinase [Candidatus Riflebacteria bacterium]